MTHQARFHPDSTTLFRYSALTFNGHRIHYDADYCRQVEGYPNLVIRGPLVAALLAGHAQQAAGKPLRQFDYRALSPALLGTALRLNAAAQSDGGWAAWCVLDHGRINMQAQARA